MGKGGKKVKKWGILWVLGGFETKSGYFLGF